MFHRSAKGPVTGPATGPATDPATDEPVITPGLMVDKSLTAIGIPVRFRRQATTGDSGSGTLDDEKGRPRMTA